MKAIKKRVIAMCMAAAVGAAGCGEVKDEPVKKTEKPGKTTSEAEYKRACYSEFSNVTDPPDKTELDEQFILAEEDFSFELLKAAALEDISQGKNALVSPQSIINALGMTANGAEDETLEQMLGVIGGGMELQKFNENMDYLSYRCGSSEEVKFNTANSLWFREGGIELSGDFLNTVSEYYSAGIYSAKFDDSTLDDINGWVNDNTDGMIPTILDRIDSAAMLYLINAICFEGEWETEYLETDINEEGVFTAFDGSEQQTATLWSEENVYLSGDNEKGFVRNYKGGDFAFMALLPDEGISLDEYINSLTGEEYAKIYADKSYESVNVMIPEFKSEYSKELSDSLSAMGMDRAFENAQFGGFTEDENGLYISRVLHKTFIEVDRKGTKAAAATAVEMNETCAKITEEPKYVILDRPFVYAIIDTESGMPLFLGAVNSVK
ncbi:MAG: serpin family protein [Oscillospiraceae bacterium]